MQAVRARDEVPKSCPVTYGADVLHHNRLVAHKPAVRTFVKSFKCFLVDYGRVRLMAKQVNVERLELLVAMWNAGTSRDVERIRNKLSDARLSYGCSEKGWRGRFVTFGSASLWTEL